MNLVPGLLTENRKLETENRFQLRFSTPAARGKEPRSLKWALMASTSSRA